MGDRRLEPHLQSATCERRERPAGAPPDGPLVAVDPVHARQLIHDLQDELRARYRSVPGELRGTLTVIPESRWLKHPDHFRWILDETLDHYADHRSDLDAIVSQAADEG